MRGNQKGKYKCPSRLNPCGNERVNTRISQGGVGVAVDCDPGSGCGVRPRRPGNTVEKASQFAVDSWNTRYEIDSLKSKINELLDSIYE